MARWIVTLDVESDDEQEVDAFAAYCANLPTDHAVKVWEFDVRSF